MGTIPSFEAILLEIQQSFGLNALQTVQKFRFVNKEKKLSDHLELARKIVTGVLDALRLSNEPKLLRDLLLTAEQHFQFNNAVANETRTFAVDDRQIAWCTLAYQFIPGLGRQYAFWSKVAPVAPGMSGGDLWFLPRPLPSEPSHLRLPVQVVVEWWLDLLDCSLDTIWDEAGGADRVRTIQNWKAGGLPSPSVIDMYFLDDHKFSYPGAYQEGPQGTLPHRFQHVLDFVRNRELDAAVLAQERPNVPATVFQAALSATATDEEKARFVAAVKGRWQAPTNDTVRRRFLLARAVQDGYIRLAKLFSPGVEPNCSDPTRNKLLQLTQLFAKAYRLTVEAGRSSKSEAESNTRFTVTTPDWLAQDLLYSIMPRQDDTPLEFFARFLTDKFRELQGGAEVSDLFAEGKLSAGPATRPTDATAVAARREIEGLIERLTVAIEAGHRAEAESLLKLLKGHPRNAEFQADIQFHEGRHRLCGNDVDGAVKCFDAAFDRCKGGGYGSLRRHVADACLGAAMAFDRFSEKHEQYFRVAALTLHPSEAEGHDPILELEHGITFRDTAVRSSERFWNVLYQPYPGVERLAPADKDLKQLLPEFFQLATSNDEGDLRQWIGANRERLYTRSRDVRADTFLGVMLKMVNMYESKVRNARVSSNLHQGFGEPAKRLRAGLYILASDMELKALNAADFKKQTPLMLAANQGDTRLVKILLDRKVDVDAQDVVGRTALHAAAASRSSESYLLILERGADPNKHTVDGSSALQTAVKFGLVEAVDATIKKWPNRFNPNELNTCRAIAGEILARYKHFRTQFAKERRMLGPKPAYKKISEILENSHGRMQSEKG